MKIDLHCHSHYSDGTLSPEELLLRAHNQQVDVLAVTDHDSISAVGELVNLQKQQKRPMQIIPGVELSTAWHGFDIHIIGLNVDWENSQFLARLLSQQNVRKERALLIAERLEAAGFSDIFPAVKRMAGVGQITRAHYARALMETGKVSSFDQAFKRYLAKGKRAFVKPKWIEVSDAVQWITEAGGVAVLAHPSRYDMTAKWLRRLLLEFKEAGGQGIEVVYPGISVVIKNQLAKYAEEYGLHGSAGSDFHSPGRWSEIGRNLALPESVKPVWQLWNLSNQG